MKCKNCGAEVGLEYRLCPYCHTELEIPERGNNQQQPQIIIQNVISNENNNSAKVVGARPAAVQQVSPKNKMVTLLLCIFGGFFGLHDFYVGKIGMGILYLFTAGLFCIGWIYDIFKILSGTYRDGAGRLIGG